jgi:hypothetical protein
LAGGVFFFFFVKSSLILHAVNRRPFVQASTRAYGVGPLSAKVFVSLTLPTGVPASLLDVANRNSPLALRWEGWLTHSNYR